MEFKLIPNDPKFYEFIRILRTDENNIDGFLERVQITPEQQIKYMEKYDKCYYICVIEEDPVGFIGVVDDDIRVCTAHEHKCKGVGLFMLTELMKIHPNSSAKILKDNLPSIKLFKKAGFEIVSESEKLYYLKRHTI